MCKLQTDTFVQKKLTVISHVWLFYSAVILMKYSKENYWPFISSPDLRPSSLIPSFD